MSEEQEEQMIPTPSTFGSFLLERELGHGGMGGVYLGRDQMLDRQVAIKVMLKSLGDDPTFVARFQREAQAAARLNHPNIAQIYSFGQENGMPYIAMELVSGGSLDKMMAGNPGKLNPVFVMTVAKQMAQALSMAAESGLVHGDVKPENVLFDTAGNAKLVDFGLAAMQGDSDEIWGTPYYISPEKVRKQKIDYRADIYSLGGTIYHALTGVAPFEGEDATAVVRARFDAPPRKPSEVRADLPKEIDDIIMRMLELEPAMRYPTYESLLGDLNRYLEKAGPVKTPTTSTSRVRIKRKGSKLKISGTTTTTATGAEAFAQGAEVSAGEGAEVPVSEGAAEVIPPPVIPEAEGAAEELDEDGEPKRRFSVGAIVGMVAGGIVLLILLVVGGLIWYTHASAAAEQEERQKQIVQKQAVARQAVKQTMKASQDFSRNFHELSLRSYSYMTNAVAQLKKDVPAEYVPLLKEAFDPEEGADVASAEAYTNEIFVAWVNEVAAAANQKAAEAEAAARAAADAAAATNATATATNAAPAVATPAATNATPAAATPAATNAAPAAATKSAATNAVPAAAKSAAKPEAKKDEKKADSKSAAKPESKPEVKKDDKKAAPAKEEVKAEAKEAAATDKPALEAPQALKDFVVLWTDVWAAKAASIRVQGRVNLLVAKGEKALKELTKQDLETTQELAALSQKLVEGLDDIKAMKCVEQTQKKSNVIRSKSQALVRTLSAQIKKAVAKAAKIAKELAAKAAKEAAEAKAAEEYKKLAAEEVAAAKAKFEQQASLVKRLDFALASRQMGRVLSDFRTEEGREELKSLQAQFDSMDTLLKHIIKNGRNFTFRSRKKVIKIDASSLTIKAPDITDRRKKKTTIGKSETFRWEKFYKTQPGLLNQFIIELVEKGKQRTHIGLKEWSSAMLGAALTMRTFHPEDPNVPKRVSDIVTKAMEDFEPCKKYAEKWFPDVSAGGGEEGESEDKKKSSDKDDEDDEEE